MDRDVNLRRQTDGKRPPRLGHHLPPPSYRLLFLLVKRNEIPDTTPDLRRVDADDVRRLDDCIVREKILRQGDGLPVHEPLYLRGDVSEALFDGAAAALHNRGPHRLRNVVEAVFERRKQIFERREHPLERSNRRGLRQPAVQIFFGRHGRLCYVGRGEPWCKSMRGEEGWGSHK